MLHYRDFIIDEFYVLKNNRAYNWIVKHAVNGHKKALCFYDGNKGIPYLSINANFGNDVDEQFNYANFDKEGQYRLATLEEKQWLLNSLQAGKVVDRPKLLTELNYEIW